MIIQSNFDLVADPILFMFLRYLLLLYPQHSFRFVIPFPIHTQQRIPTTCQPKYAAQIYIYFNELCKLFLACLAIEAPIASCMAFSDWVLPAM